VPSLKRFAPLATRALSARSQAVRHYAATEHDMVNVSPSAVGQRAATTWSHGACLVLMESWDPLRVLARLERERCTVFDTRAAFTEDGRFRTGDLAAQDSQATPSSRDASTHGDKVQRITLRERAIEEADR
jgi:hypothetical protein